MNIYYVDFDTSHCADEGSPFDALQTLADLSLMMPATIIEDGKLIFIVRSYFLEII